MTKPGLQLGDRDEELLILIGLVRYLSLDLVALALFPSVERARKRTKQLGRAGLVRLSGTLRSTRSARLVALSPRGLALARTLVDPDVGSKLRLAGTVNEVGIDHHLGLVAVRLYLSAFADTRRRSEPNVARTGECTTLGSHNNVHSTFHDVGSSPQTLKRWWSGGDPELASQGFGSLRLRPDAVALMGSLRLAIEVDVHATEALSVIKAKIELYAQAVALRLVDELWFVVDAGHRRSASIASLLSASPLAAVSRVLDLSDHVLRRPVTVPPPVVAPSLNERLAPRHKHQSSVPQTHPYGSRSAAVIDEPHSGRGGRTKAPGGSGA